jgi:hypothetical protein
MNNTLTSAEGLSSAIQSIQEELYDALLTSWLGNIEGFGKVYKNVQNSSEDIPKFYKSSKIFVPEVYNSSKGNYEDVFYSNSKSCVFCFLVHDKDTTEDETLFTSKVKIVFMVNLSMIYPNRSGRQDDRAQKDIVKILRDVNGDYKINEVERGIDNIFNQYTTSGVKFDDIHPLHSFAVNIDLNYYLTDECQAIVRGTSSSSGGGGGGGDGGNIPVVNSTGSNFIQLDTSFTYSVSATNSPTSYTAFGLIAGLTFDTSTGIVSGTVTGAERLESMAFTASNSYGSSSSTIIFFRTTTDDPTVLHPPKDVNASEINLVNKNFRINWGYRPYNGEISFVEIWKNNALMITLPGSTYTARLIQNAGGTHNYKMRFKNSLGEFSGFSTEITVIIPV